MLAEEATDADIVTRETWRLNEDGERMSCGVWAALRGARSIQRDLADYMLVTESPKVATFPRAEYCGLIRQAIDYYCNRIVKLLDRPLPWRPKQGRIPDSREYVAEILSRLREGCPEAVQKVLDETKCELVRQAEPKPDESLPEVLEAAHELRNGKYDRIDDRYWQLFRKLEAQGDHNPHRTILRHHYSDVGRPFLLKAELERRVAAGEDAPPNGDNEEQSTGKPTRAPEIPSAPAGHEWTELEQQVLKKLYYCAWTAEDLARLCAPADGEDIIASIDYVLRTKNPLRRSGIVDNQRRLGYFRTDARPQQEPDGE